MLCRLKFWQLVLALIVLSATSIVFSDDGKEDRFEARTLGSLPRLNITTYLNIAMEPHNAMVQVTQNWLNFCMGTLFWFTSAAIYYRVNDPNIGPFYANIKNKPNPLKPNITSGHDNHNHTTSNNNSSSRGYDEIFNIGLTEVIDWITGYEAADPETDAADDAGTEDGSGTGRRIEENPVKVFLSTFATVLTGVANVVEAADRFFDEL